LKLLIRRRIYEGWIVIMTEKLVGLLGSEQETNKLAFSLSNRVESQLFQIYTL